MTERWIDTKTESESKSHAGDFWEALRNERDAGDFWADRIKNFRGEPLKRLSMALEKLPLPAAFCEAAVATRSLIKEKRKHKEDYEEELTFLYWLAVVRSFLLDYAPKLKMPGFNVVASMPGKLLKSLPFTYSKIGYKKLELLNKTDCKWLVETWGEAQVHSTLNKLHRIVWDEYESKAINEQQRDMKKRFAEWDLLLHENEPIKKSSGTPRFLIILIVFMILTYIFYG